jgi:hypothetical protein
MKFKRILSTLLAGVLSLSLLGAAAPAEETTMENVNYGSVDVDDKEIVLEFDLDYKGEFAETISAADFELDYGFNTMTIKSIDWEDDMAFNITLDGKIDRNYETAQVRILSSAFTDGREKVDITFDVVKPQMFIDYQDIKLKDGILSLPISLYQCRFDKAAAVPHFTLTGDVPAKIKGVKKPSDTTAIIELEVTGELDEVLKAIDTAALDGAALEISGEALTTINGAAMNLDMPFEEVVPIIEETAVNADGTIQVLCRLFGYAGEIDTSLITLGGDFAYEEAAFAVSDNNETLISFKVAPAKDFDLISGTITLAAGALTNPWGTPSEELIYSRSISYDEVYNKASAEPEDGAATMGFVPFDQIGEYSYMPYQEFSQIEASEMSIMGVLGTIGTIGSVFGAINNTQTLGEKVANFLGITEQADPLAPVMKELGEIKQGISNLNVMINSLTVDVAVEGAKTRVNSFNEKLVSMEEFVKTINNEIEVEIRTMLRTSDAKTALAGELFDSLTPEEQEEAIERFTSAAASFKSNPNISNTTILIFLGGSKGNVTNIVFSKAAHKIGLKKYEGSPFSGIFVDDYKALCNYVIGGTSQSILVDFDTIINGTYNWESEAYEKRGGYRVMVLSRLIDAGKALNICLDAYSIDYPKADLENAYNSAVRYITTGAGSTKDRSAGLASNKEFNVTINKTLTYYKAFGTTKPLFTAFANAYQDPKMITTEELKLIKIRANRLGCSLRDDMALAGFTLPPKTGKDGGHTYINAGNISSNGLAPNPGSMMDIQWGSPGYYLDDKTSLELEKWLQIYTTPKFVANFNTKCSYLATE